MDPPEEIKEEPLYQITVLYNHPEDPEAFDKHYREVHIPLVNKMPGLTGYYVNWCEAGADGPPTPYHVIAMLIAESKEAALGAMNSSEGQAAVADLANFAGAGVQMSFGEVTSEL
jgi:uncharacterized protein (TIGR02118 family)